MRALVTGASGRLGPHVVAELERAGHEPVLFSRREPSKELMDRWQWVQGDLSVYEDCLRAVKNRVEAIQHLGAQPGPTDHPSRRQADRGSGPPFDATMRTNIMGTYYLLRAALECDVEILVMTGSNCALGHGMRISDAPFPLSYLPLDEAHPSDVEDSYSFSKLVDEMLLGSYTRAYGMRTYALRSAGICDEQRRRGMARQAAPANGWNPWLWAWVGSEDVASAHRLLMEKAREIEPHGVYFCNADDTTALEPSRELVERFRPELLPLLRGLEGHESMMSNRRLRQAVGWQHQTSWRQHLAESQGGHDRG